MKYFPSKLNLLLTTTFNCLILLRYFHSKSFSSVIDKSKEIVLSYFKASHQTWKYIHFTCTDYRTISCGLKGIVKVTIRNVSNCLKIFESRRTVYA